MRHRAASLWILAAALLLAPAAALAQPISYPAGPPVDTWLEVHLGASFAQHSDLDGLDPGVAVGGAFGARFMPWLGVELGLGYEGASGRKDGVRLTARAVPIAASLRVRAPLRAVELSVYGGPNLHLAWLDTDPPAASGRAGVSDGDVAFGGHVGAGLAFQLSPTLLVGADVRRTFVEPRFDAARVRFDALRTAVTLTYHL